MYFPPGSSALHIYSTPSSPDRSPLHRPTQDALNSITPTLTHPTAKNCANLPFQPTTGLDVSSKLTDIFSIITPQSTLKTMQARVGSMRDALLFPMTSRRGIIEGGCDPPWPDDPHHDRTLVFVGRAGLNPSLEAQVEPFWAGGMSSVPTTLLLIVNTNRRCSVFHHELSDGRERTRVVRCADS